MPKPNADADKAALPEKCCATCGFLYGLGYGAIDRSNSAFDPDLIRMASYSNPFSENTGGLPQAFVTSVPYTLQRVWEEAGTLHVGPPEARHYTWAFVRSINCYHDVFRPITMSRFLQNRPMDAAELEAAESQYLPINLDTVTTEIRRDRSDCKGYFHYHRGFTAVEHVTMQLEDRRFERVQRSSDSITRATWIAALAAIVSVLAAIAVIVLPMVVRH